MKVRKLEKVSLGDIKILRTVSKTLTVGHKYFFVKRDKLTQPIQIQLSQKQKSFSEFFHAFAKSRLNFQHFFKKDDPHSCCISEITDSKKHGEINV